MISVSSPLDDGAVWLWNAQPDDQAVPVGSVVNPELPGLHRPRLPTAPAAYRSGVMGEGTQSEPGSTGTERSPVPRRSLEC